MSTTRPIKQRKWDSRVSSAPAFLRIIRWCSTIGIVGSRWCRLAVPRVKGAGCNGIAVPFSPTWHGEPAAEAEIDLGRLTVAWDTGAPISMLSKKFVESTRLQQSADTVSSKRLELGGTDFGPLQFQVEDLSLPPGMAGFIGYNFFAH